MQLHQVQPKTPHRKPKLIGRGGKRGTTSGRGTKGQRARSGHRIRPELRDTLKRLPKLRGRGRNQLKSAYKPDAAVVNLDALDKAFAANEEISPASLEAKGLITNADLSMGKIKILGRGKLTRALTVSGCFVSASALKAIVTAGGKMKENKK